MRCQLGLDSADLHTAHHWSSTARIAGIDNQWKSISPPLQSIKTDEYLQKSLWVSFRFISSSVSWHFINLFVASCELFMGERRIDLKVSARKRRSGKIITKPLPIKLCSDPWPLLRPADQKPLEPAAGQSSKIVRRCLKINISKRRFYKVSLQDSRHRLSMLLLWQGLTKHTFKL